MRNFAALFLFSFSVSAQAATFLVDNGADITDAVPGDGKCSFLPNPPPNGGTCTLRAAIMEANATAVHDTIQLAAGATYLLTRPGQNENNAVTGDLDIRNPVTIQPPTFFGIPTGIATVHANGLDRVFHIINVQGAGVTLNGLKIQGGDFGGDAENPAGGISVLTSKAQLSFLDVSALSGDGLFVKDSPVAKTSLSHSTVSGSADRVAIGIVGAQVDVESSSLVNSAYGIDAQHPAARLVMRNSTISGHSIGIHASSGAQFDVTDCTIADNSNRALSVSGEGSVISVKRSLFTSNRSVNQGVGSCSALSGGLFSMEDNIYDDDTCPIGGPADNSLFNQTIYLSLLGDHGGPTPTHRPMTISPALDAITGPSCSGNDYDQRLMPRAVAFKGGQAACDIGAVELETDVIFFDQVDRL